MDLEHLLVVSDNDLERKHLCQKLEKFGGFKTLAADSPDSAVESLACSRVDLVVLDLAPDNRITAETLKQLRGRFSLQELPILVLSSLNNEAAQTTLLHLGASDIVEKPVVVKLLLARIRTHLKLQKKLKENLRPIARMSAMEDAIDFGFRELVNSMRSSLFKQTAFTKLNRDKIAWSLDLFKERFEKARSLSGVKNHLTGLNYFNLQADVQKRGFMAKKLLAGKRILCVDDDDIWRMILREELELHGAVVAEAASEFLALDLFQNDKFSAVISDLQMPGPDGFSLMKKVKTLSPTTPIVLLSGALHLTAESAFRHGASAFFEKPCEFEGLIRALSTILETGQSHWTRKYDRLPVNLSVGVNIDKILHETNTVNIGRGGMYLNFGASSPPPVGKEVSFDLALPGNQRELLTGQGIVRWQKPASSTPAGFGVEFLKIPNEELISLLNKVRQAQSADDEAEN